MLLCVLLLLFAWQQNRGLRLASEVARLEAREDALSAGLLELGAQVSRLYQPEFLMSQLPAADRTPDLEQRVALRGSPLPAAAPPSESGHVWLASLGFEVPSALAAKGE